MSTATLSLTPTLYEYLLQHSLREPAVLKKLRELTATLPGAVMQVSPEQGQFMALLIKLLGAKKTIDVGTFTGYSALIVALALPVNGKVVACDTDARVTDIAQQFWREANVREKIDLRLAPALDTLHNLIANGETGTYDFIFIDADKNNYLNYYELALQLLRPGGLIAVDNVLWSGRVVDMNDTEKNTCAIRELNSFIHGDKRAEISMIPIGDGLTLARKY